LAGRVGCAAEARRRATVGSAPSPPPARRWPGDTLAPDDLGEAGARLWLAVVGEYELDPPQRTILAMAAREADAAAAADLAVDTTGRFVTGRFGQLQLHPGVAAARSARLAMSRLLRAATAPSDEAA
jgi:hypothetical protein